ncbi:MAG: D-glycerate dehydrogenase [Gammaproteobacteria bacterium]
MSKPKVLVTRAWPEEVEAEMRKRYDVTLNATDTPMTVAELQDALRNYDAVCPTVCDRITAEVLGAQPMRAKILGNFGVGFNHVDLEAARKAGLTVTNTPEVLTDCTADIAMTLMLMAARRAGEGERHVRTKAWTGWRPTHMISTKVTGKTLGLIGMGRIARAMAHKAHHGFDMKIVYFDPFPPPPESIKDLNATQCGSIEEVLKQADVVSLHCPGGKENYHLINAERLKAMKRDAILINTARGDVVEEKALVEALKNGTIKSAGLDVFEAEPKVTEDLLAMENVVLLPHLGSATRETRVAMGMRVLENLDLFFAGRPVRDKVV